MSREAQPSGPPKRREKGAEEPQPVVCPATPERRRGAAHKMQSPSALQSPPPKAQHATLPMGFLSPLHSHGLLSPTTPKSQQDYYHYVLGLSPLQILPGDSPSVRTFSPQASEPPTFDKFCWSPASPRHNMHDEFMLASLHSPPQVRNKKGVKALDFGDAVVDTPSKRPRSDSDTASIFSSAGPYDANAKALLDRLNDSRGAHSPNDSKFDGDDIRSPPRGLTLPFPVVDDMDPGDPFNTEQASAALLSLSTSPIRSPTPKKTPSRARKPSGRALDTHFVSPANTPSTRSKPRTQRSSARGKKLDNPVGSDTPADRIKKAHQTPIQSPKKKSKIGSQGKASSSKPANENEEALGLLEAVGSMSEKGHKGAVAHHLLLESPKRHLSAVTAPNSAARSAHVAGGAESPSKPKPPGCNCKKSKCLKLYCECFQQQKFCQHCNCRDCQNTVVYAELRQQAIDSILERNPLAFEPKIKDGTTGGKHITGCHCKKSACLKKYCECFQAGVPCADKCRCIDCQNTVAGRIFDVKTPEPRKTSRAPTQTVISSKASASANRPNRVTPVSLNDTVLSKEAATLSDALKDPMTELALVTLLSQAMSPQQQAEALAGINIDPVAALESLKSNLASAQLLFGLSQSMPAPGPRVPKKYQRPNPTSLYGLDSGRQVKPVFGPNAGPVSALRTTALTLSFLDDRSLGRVAMASRRGRDSLLECGFQLTA